MPEKTAYSVEWVSIEDLSEHPENYNEHPEEQLEKIRASIRRFGIYKNIVVAKDLTILAGHGVVKGAKLEDYERVPVYRVALDPHDPLAKQLLVSDNSLSLLSEENESQLADLLKQIEEDSTLDLEETGYNDEDLQAMLDDIEGNGQEEGKKYSDRVQTPTYEPSGEQPNLAELFDATKAGELIQELEEADISEEQKDFLRFAAYRHIRFNFDRIADYYAHADPEMQRLMEKSALVIIDFEDAIEEGFVTLTKEMQQIIDNQDGGNE